MKGILNEDNVVGLYYFPTNIYIYNWWWKWPESQEVAQWLILWKPHKPPPRAVHPFKSKCERKIKHLMPPNFMSTLRFPLCFCFCANYLSFQNSSLSQRQMDFSSLLRYKLKAHRKSCEQLQGLRPERPLGGSQTNAVCQISSIYWQETPAAAGRRGQSLSYCSQRPTTLSLNQTH